MRSNCGRLPYCIRMSSVPLEERLATLSRRQQRMIDRIGSITVLRGYPPSIREIARELRMSIGTVHAELRALENDGLIYRTHGRARALELADHYVSIPAIGMARRVGRSSQVEAAESRTQARSLLDEDWS